MAHGFLTPEPVSGDNFWKNAKDLWNTLQKLKKRKAPPDEVVPAIVSELQKALPPAKQKLLSPASQKLLSGKNQAALSGAKAPNMLTGSPVSKMLSSGKSEITIKQQLSLPPGGPRLPPSGGMPDEPSAEKKGGSFIDMPGVSAAPKKLDSEAFFKAAQTGVHPETGKYLNSEERKDFLKKSKTKMDAPASVASAGIASASTSVTKGDEQIVASVEDLTKVVVSLVDAVKAQTASQAKSTAQAKASAERTANRALASSEEGLMEEGADLSGTITPTYSTATGALTPGASPAGPGGGGGGGGPGFGIGGKVAAQSIAKHGLGRALPRLGAHVAGRTGAKLGAKTAAKIGLAGAGKSLAKKIPGVGLLAGLGFGAQRLFSGDPLGALGEVASGAASTVPGLGTAASVGIDAALAARDMGATPFAAGGIVTSPTFSLTGEKGKEGVFPLQGKEGKKTFTMFGEGMFEAQKKHKTEYAKIQSAGLRQYYENEDGGKKLGKSLSDIWSKIGGVLGSLFSGTLTSLMGGNANAGTLDQAADYLAGDTSSLASFIGGVESGNDYTKLVGGKKDEGILNKTVSQLNQEKGGQFAMGRYQIQMRTAIGALKKAGIDPSKFKFDQAGQDKLFQLLLEGRGYKDFMSGKMSKEQFATNLSMEWAALPKDASGKSYYAGVGNNKAHRGWGDTLAQLDTLKQSGSPMGPPGTVGSTGSSALAAAAVALKGKSTKDGPDGGRNGCVYAVNKVYKQAGITPPWGASEYVPDAETKMQKAGYSQVSYNARRPGDVMVMYDRKSPPQCHIGVVLGNGKVLSNSSRKAQFNWEATPEEYNNYYGGQGKIYRMPGGTAASTIARNNGNASPSNTPTSNNKPRTKADLIGSNGAAAPPRTRSRKRPPSAAPTASPADIALGNAIAQRSSDTALATASNGSRTTNNNTTVVNNNNNSSGAGGGTGLTTGTSAISTIYSWKAARRS